MEFWAMPACCEPLKAHLPRVKRLHADDVAKGFEAVYLPDALDRKYPNASREWK